MTYRMLFVGLIFSALTCSHVMQPAKAADPPAPLFRNTGALLSLGQDNRIYLAGSNGDSVLRCKRDGTNPVIGKTAYALTGATANKDGLMAAGHAHFARYVGLYDSDFNTVGRFSRLGDGNFSAPSGIEAGPSGDFYALDQGRDQVIRFHPDG